MTGNLADIFRAASAGPFRPRTFRGPVGERRPPALPKSALAVSERRLCRRAPTPGRTKVGARRRDVLVLALADMGVGQVFKRGDDAPATVPAAFFVGAYRRKSLKGSI